MAGLSEARSFWVIPSEGMATFGVAVVAYERLSLPDLHNLL